MRGILGHSQLWVSAPLPDSQGAEWGRRCLISHDASYSTTDPGYPGVKCYTITNICAQRHRCEGELSHVKVAYVYINQEAGPIQPSVPWYSRGGEWCLRCLCLDKVWVEECCRNPNCSVLKCAQRRLTAVRMWVHVWLKERKNKAHSAFKGKTNKEWKVIPGLV